MDAAVTTLKFENISRSKYFILRFMRRSKILWKKEVKAMTPLNGTMHIHY